MQLTKAKPIWYMRSKTRNLPKVLVSSVQTNLELISFLIIAAIQNSNLLTYILQQVESKRAAFLSPVFHCTIAFMVYLKAFRLSFSQ